MASLLCLVMYVHNITREVGKKLWPETPMDEPLFMYHYGYSFFNVIASYLCTELAAFLILFVYMAKHDEQMYNRYKIRALFKSKVLGNFFLSTIVLRLHSDTVKVQYFAILCFEELYSYFRRPRRIKQWGINDQRNTTSALQTSFK